MHPELFTIPFTELTVKSYGLMMVIGFICAIAVIKRLSKKITPDPQLIINAALYSLDFLAPILPRISFPVSENAVINE